MTEQPSHSNFGPQQMSGRHGALGLQHTSQLRQHKPIFPEQPTQSASCMKKRVDSRMSEHQQIHNALCQRGSHSNIPGRYRSSCSTRHSTRQCFLHQQRRHPCLLSFVFFEESLRIFCDKKVADSCFFILQRKRDWLYFLMWAKWFV